MKKETPYLFFILPALIILVIIIAFPFIFNIYMSFTRWDLRYRGAVPEFIGIGNYVKAFQDLRFINSLSKTFYLLSVAVPLEFLFGLILALVFFEPFKMRRLLSAIILFPLALSEAVIGLIWGLILVPTYGPLDLIMRTFGLWELIGFKKPISLVTTYPMEMIILADIWQWTPFFFLVLLAGLASIPKEILESAEIDGASKVNIVRHMMLPLTKPIIGVILVMRIMDVFKSFGIPYIMTKGGPGFASEVVSLYIFNQALQFLNVTYAAALTIMVIIMITLILTAFVRGYGIRF
ncbi:MAG: sugar ABC transporter permease [Nitrososphaeria archaeon]|nr:sugar ABC transporter permease [Nitrososphaeria archaeon]